MYTPGPRFLLELRPFLKEMFGEGDITDCASCKDPVVRVRACNQDETDGANCFYFFIFRVNYVANLVAASNCTRTAQLAWLQEG